MFIAIAFTHRVGGKWITIFIGLFKNIIVLFCQPFDIGACIVLRSFHRAIRFHREIGGIVAELNILVCFIKVIVIISEDVLGVASCGRGFHRFVHSALMLTGFAIHFYGFVDSGGAFSASAIVLGTRHRAVEAAGFIVFDIHFTASAAIIEITTEICARGGGVVDVGLATLFGVRIDPFRF